MDRKRIAWLEGRHRSPPPYAVMAGVAGVVMLLVGRHWPKDQTVHYVLGNAAQNVEELDARWVDASSAPAPLSGGDWTRTVSFRYEKGQAPRVVTHEPRLPDGKYTVEIEIVASLSERNQHVTLLSRDVSLHGGVTSIDLAPSLVELQAPQ